jgi:predicted GNAT family acetyltransferase
MEGIAVLARERGLKIVPRCPYAAAWFRRHADASDVLA